MFNWTEVPLYPEESYSYKMNIEGESRKLVFNLNKRSGVYHLDIYSENNVAIVQGIPLLPRNALLNNYALSAQGITGYFILLPFNFNVDFNSVPPERLNEYYALFYIYGV